MLLLIIENFLMYLLNIFKKLHNEDKNSMWIRISFMLLALGILTISIGLSGITLECLPPIFMRLATIFTIIGIIMIAIGVLTIIITDES